MITHRELKDASVAPIPEELIDNYNRMHKVLNQLRLLIGIPMIPTSFYRTVEHEKKQGRSGRSDHTKCLACDFRDRDRRLAKWALNHEEELAELGLYVEDPDYTPTWFHVCLVKKSKIIFRPY